MPPAFSFAPTVGLGQGQPVLPRLATFEASCPHSAAGFGPGIVDGAGKPVCAVTPELGAVAVDHRHVRPAIHHRQSLGRDRARGVFRQDGDIAVMGTKAAGAAGHAIRGSGGQSMNRGADAGQGRVLPPALRQAPDTAPANGPQRPMPCARTKTGGHCPPAWCSLRLLSGRPLLPAHRG